MQKKVLGKGLDAILAEDRPANPPGSSLAAAPQRAPQPIQMPLKSVIELPLDRIVASPRQPRRHFDDGKLSELADSIAQEGVIQPILVTQRGDRYEIVAGERRYRASHKAGRTSIPAILTEVDERESLKLALIENLQREDLNPIEEAQAYRVMVDEFAWTQEELGAHLGKDRSTVSNTLRLLQLPDEVQDMVARGALSAGHVRALIKLDRATCLELARMVERRSLSVRQVERLAKVRKPAPARPGPASDPLLRSIRAGLEARIGLPVQLDYRGGRGKLVVSFASDRELERIMQALGVSLDGAH
ncbi:ParB/RepB/Spo0J family partition protein [bacterium]|nr:ParB/RepB/Spo0J family partition protein [bacterium]